MVVSFKHIKIERLMLAVVMVFVIADTCPHPGLAPGFIQTVFNQVSVFAPD
jgi:hypothetical protein